MMLRRHWQPEKKKRKHYCGVTHEKCLHPNYSGTECYSKDCENIKYMNFTIESTRFMEKETRKKVLLKYGRHKNKEDKTNDRAK